jgi:hypothetical protein
VFLSTKHAAGVAVPLCIGLQTFRRLLRRPAVVLPLLAAYTSAYPGWVELSAIWDAQASRSSGDMRITVELLELHSQLLTLPKPPVPTAAAGGGAAAAAAALGATWSSLQPALDDLAASILARRLKQLYFALGSGGARPAREGASCSCRSHEPHDLVHPVVCGMPRLASRLILSCQPPLVTGP